MSYQSFHYFLLQEIGALSQHPNISMCIHYFRLILIQRIQFSHILDE